MATTAAVLIGISSTGGFQEKWQANRLAAAKLEGLAYDLLKKPFSDDDRERVISKLQEISLSRNKKISDEEGYAQEKATLPQ